MLTAAAPLIVSPLGRVHLGALQTYASDKKYEPSHPCGNESRGMGWPAGGFLPRVLYVAHHAGVACAIGHGCCDRGPPTRRLILDGLSSVATAQGLPNFRAVRICMHDAHCNECSLAFGVFSTHGPGRTCVERPFPFITMLSVDATAASYSSNASTPAPLAGVVSSRVAAMARLRPPPTPPPLQRRCGWIGGITDWREDGSHPPGLMASGGSTRARLINVSLSTENAARRGGPAIEARRASLQQHAARRVGPSGGLPLRPPTPLLTVV